MQHKEVAMNPLPFVTLVIGLFLACVLGLAALIVADWLVEHRLNPSRRDTLQLNVESLIRELTAYT
jgi:hypothetical protein